MIPGVGNTRRLKLNLDYQLAQLADGCTVKALNTPAIAFRSNDGNRLVSEIRRMKTPTEAYALRSCCTGPWQHVSDKLYRETYSSVRLTVKSTSRPSTIAMRINSIYEQMRLLGKESHRRD